MYEMYRSGEKRNFVELSKFVVNFIQNKLNYMPEVCMFELFFSDEKGIIMGEFGFITADGIYHITVYATDENGNFKILKMKNIKVGFRK